MKKTSKLRILEAKRKWMKLDKPNWNDAEIQNFMYYDKSDNSTNGLTACIIDFLKYSGHQAERINTTGTPRPNRVIDGQTGKPLGNQIRGVIFTKGSGTKGSADISAVLAPFGRSLKIEVKFAKDRQSDAQKSYESSINAVGGIYYIARNFDDFLKFYDDIHRNI